jgi:hypothetical protein
MKYILLSTIIIAMLTVSGCRKADWFLRKAIEKGAKVDSTVAIVHDSVYINSADVGPVMDYTFMDPGVNVDTVIIREICSDPVPVRRVKNLQKKICPQVDSVYNVVVEVQGKVYRFPIRIELNGGEYRLTTTTLKVPYRKAETNVSLRTTRGLTHWQGVILAAGGLVLGLLAGLLTAARLAGRRV